MKYKVPQNVQREDQILWFITLKQLIMLLIGGGISYMMFVNLNKKYDLHSLEQILVWFPAGIAVAFAFVKIKSIPLLQFILLLIEQGFFRVPRRYWQENSDVFVSMTTGVKLKEKGKKEIADKKEVSQEKIKNLAALLDGQKSKKINS
ncbi:PrgI family protein [Candidatus Gracilibacteria bacterium]|nr:PrgI family protein [Candidatus Gracilibacteria bacterium]